MKDVDLVKTMALDFFSSSFDEENNKERIVDLVHKAIQMGPDNSVMFIGNIMMMISMFREYMEKIEPKNKEHILSMLKRFTAKNYGLQFHSLSETKQQTKIDDFGEEQ